MTNFSLKSQKHKSFQCLSNIRFNAVVYNRWKSLPLFPDLTLLDGFFRYLGHCGTCLPWNAMIHAGGSLVLVLKVATQISCTVAIRTCKDMILGLASGILFFNQTAQLMVKTHHLILEFTRVLCHLASFHL